MEKKRIACVVLIEPEKVSFFKRGLLKKIGIDWKKTSDKIAVL